MKILSISSSYRKYGNTEQIVRLMGQALIDEAKKQGMELDIEYVNLNNIRISSCRGCRACFEISELKCPVQDDALLLYEKMKLADGIILGSPIYVEDVNGLMKNWIDRMAFNCHRPFLSGKPVMILLTSGAQVSKHALRTLSSAANAWGGTISGSSTYPMGRLMASETAKEEFKDTVRKQAVKMLERLRKREPSVYSLVAFTIQQKYWRLKRHDRSSVDYLYWKNNGWLEKHCYYYKKGRIPLLKLKISRTIGNTIGMFFAR